MVETFRKHWFLDRVTSSAGFVITVRRDRIIYRDAFGQFDIDAEWSPGRGVHMKAFTSSIPDSWEGRSAAMIVSDVQRAFGTAGWTLRVGA